MKKQYLEIKIGTFLVLLFLLMIIFTPRHVLAGSCTCTGNPKDFPVANNALCTEACSFRNAGDGTFTSPNCKCATASSAPFKVDTQNQCNTECGKTHDGTPTWASADPTPTVGPPSPVKFAPSIGFITIKSPAALISRIIKTVLGIIGAVALLMFVYGGIMWMTSGGSPERIKKAQTTLVWAVLGMAVIFASYALVDFILKAFGV